MYDVNFGRNSSSKISGKQGKVLKEESKFLSALGEIGDLLNEKMSILLPDVHEDRESKLNEAMRYAALSEGKRIRPFLTIVSSDLFGVSRSSSLQAAVAIELVHAYSLVHDDLPAMDDDDMRRGVPSCHKKFGEAEAILAGDALLTYAFEILAEPATHFDGSVRCELIASLAKAIGFSGMVGGQMLDMLIDDKEITIHEITRLQRMKTGALFAIACEAGAILGKAPKNLRTALRGYAHAVGLAFQITDDLLDNEQDNTERRDKSSGKATYVNALGIEKAGEQARMLIEQAIAHLTVFDHRADLLRDLANFVISRKS